MNWTRGAELLSHLNMTGFVLFSTASLLAAFFLFVYRQKRQDYLLVWSIGWLLIALHFVSRLLGPAVVLPRWFDVLNEWLLALAALAFYSASRLYARLTLAARGLIAAAGVAAIWALAYAHDYLRAPLGLGIGLVFFFVAQTFWQEGKKQDPARTSCLP